MPYIVTADSATLYKDHQKTKDLGEVPKDTVFKAGKFYPDGAGQPVEMLRVKGEVQLADFTFNGGWIEREEVAVFEKEDTPEPPGEEEEMTITTIIGKYRVTADVTIERLPE